MKPVPTRTPVTADLLSGNPMMAEVSRNIRKLAGMNLAPATRKAALISLGMMYSFFLILVGINRGGPMPEVILYIQTFVYCLYIPSVTHNAIVGERERRSWDMLLVAPVTPAQIVVAKFATGVTTIAITTAALFPALMLGSIGSGRSIGAILLAEIVSITFAICLNSFALAVSAKAKRSLHAQMAIYGTTAGTLLLWPILVTILAPANTAVLLVLNLLNPFILINQLVTGQIGEIFATLPGWQIGFYAIAAIFFLYRSHRNVVRDAQQDSDSA